MHRFYSIDIGKEEVQLDNEETRHLFKVLRLKEGDAAECVDGKGNLFECEVINAKKGVLKIVSTISKDDKKYGIWIAMAPTKNLSRWEWFLEKSCEVGIDRISPIITKHSERKILKLERQKKILIGAMKQSQKTVLPQLDEPSTFKDFITSSKADQTFIAHCRNDIKKEDLKKLVHKNTNTLILIGPEGDFSEDEILLAQEKGFKGINLSESRLRTETAGIVACLSLHLLNA